MYFWPTFSQVCYRPQGKFVTAIFLFYSYPISKEIHYNSNGIMIQNQAKNASGPLSCWVKLIGLNCAPQVDGGDIRPFYLHRLHFRCSQGKQQQFDY